MCGRFARRMLPESYAEPFELASVPELKPSFNVAPTQPILVAREHDGKREGVAMRWGLIPSWAKDKKSPQINARSETAATKPMFRSAFKKRRCLILADGYFEWKAMGKLKQPFLYALKDGKPFAFAGLWETWHGDGEPLETCAILTTAANDLARQVHDRMPVILTGEQAFAWIDPGIDDTAGADRNASALYAGPDDVRAGRSDGKLGQEQFPEVRRADHDRIGERQLS